MNSSGFTQIDSRYRPSQVCVAHTIIRVVELVTRKYVKRGINNRFSLLNNTGLLLAMLYSYKEVYKNMEYRVFLVLTTIEGTKY